MAYHKRPTGKSKTPKQKAKAELPTETTLTYDDIRSKLENARDKRYANKLLNMLEWFDREETPEIRNKFAKHLRDIYKNNEKAFDILIYDSNINRLYDAYTLIYTELTYAISEYLEKDSDELEDIMLYTTYGNMWDGSYDD